MKRLLVLGVAALGLAGCKVTEKAAIDKAKDMIASTLKDPDRQDLGMCSVQVLRDMDTYAGK